MKIYKASEELAQILIKNGFTEVTSERYPDHYKRILENGYDPHKSKRAFAMNAKNFVLFDYVMIKPFHKEGCKGTEMNPEFSEDEIRSIIAFFHLPFQTRNSYKREGSDIPNLHSSYTYLKDNPDYKKGNRQIIIDAFENVKL